METAKPMGADASAIPAERARFWRRIGALIVALVPSALYLLTLQNGLTAGELLGGDMITHHYAQATARFANAPGYPLFTMLGWLWFRLSAVLSPWLNPVERLSLYSTLYAVPSLLLLYALLLQVQRPLPNVPRSTKSDPLLVATLGARPASFAALAMEGSTASVQFSPGVEVATTNGALSNPSPNAKDAAPGSEPSSGAVAIAVAATLFLAFTYFFWYYAVAAENYSSGVLNTLVILWLAFRWQERRDTATLLWLAFACGVSLAHLLTVALAVPALVVFVVAQQPHLLRRPKLLAQTAFAALLPLLSYAYVYWRGAAHPEWRGAGNWSSAWAWFSDFLTTKQGQGELTWGWDGIPWQVLGLIAGELTPLLLIGGLAGLFFLPRWRAALLLGIVAAYVPFVYVDRYGNWYQAIIPLYPLFVIGAVALFHRAAAWLERRVPPRAVAAAMAAILMLLAGERLVANFPRANLRDRPAATGLAPGWALLADDPAPGARIAGTQDEARALDYLTRIWGARSDISSVGIKDAPRYLGEPLYATRAAMPLLSALLPPAVRLSSQGVRLVALATSPATAMPPGATPFGKPLARGIELAGYSARRDGTTLRLTLYWRAAQPPDRDMAVSVRLLSGGREVAQRDTPHPVGGFYPFTRWQPGEVVRDDYTLAVPDGAAVDAARIILYHPEGGAFVNDGVVEVGVR